MMAADKNVGTSHSSSVRSAVYEGIVCIIDQEFHVKRYLKAYCGGGDDGQLAMLEAFENAKHANEGKHVFKLRAIAFSDVIDASTNINKCQEIIIIRVKSEDDLVFYAKSEDVHKKWLGYCNVLLKFQKHVIPEVPKHNLVSQECASRYADPSKFGAASIFVVYLIKEGLASTLGLSGLHIITIKESNSTFNIYAYHTEKSLVTWNQDAIRRSGCIGPLVFIESGRRCQGGEGLLWMYCPPSSYLREFLHNFIHPDEKKPIMSTPSESVSADPPVNCTYLRSSESRHLLRDPNVPSQTCSTPKPKGGCDKSMQGSGTHPSWEHGKPEFRSRSKVISKSQGSTFRQSESYTKFKSKKLTQPTQEATGSETTDTQKPPPLPPKPDKLSLNATMSPHDEVAAFTNSESAVTSVYQLTQPLLPKSSHSLPSSLPAIPKNEKASHHDVLKRCAVIINNKLDIDTIMPHLLSHNLLTQKDQQFLLNKYHTDHEKVQYLLCQLPRKAEGWFESFLECLRESKQGTGHMEIAKDLEAAKLQNDKELSNMKTDNHLTVPVPVTDDTDVPFPLCFFDSQSSDSVCTLHVLPSETVESLMARVSKELCISPSKAVKMEMKGVPLSHGKSVRESKISRYSYIIVRVQNDDGQ